MGYQRFEECVGEVQFTVVVFMVHARHAMECDDGTSERHGKIVASLTLATSFGVGGPCAMV